MAGDSHPTIRVGAAQIAEVYLDREATIEKDREYIHRAGDRGIDLLVFPEFHVPAAPQWHARDDDDLDFEAYYQRLFDNAVTVPGPATDALCEAAREAGTAVVIGVNEKVAGTAGTLYNSLVFIDADGTMLGARRKLVPTKTERLFHTGGSGADVRTFDSSLGTLGGLMCGEHTNHLAGFSLLALGEAIHAAAWPAFPGYDDETREMRVGVRTRYHAFCGGVPAVSASGVVTDELADAIGDPDLATGGGSSAVIAPNGEYLAGPRFDGEGIVEATVDLGARVRQKAGHDVIGHYNRFDVFRLSVDRRPHDPIDVIDGDGSRAGDASMDVEAIDDGG